MNPRQAGSFVDALTGWGRERPNETALIYLADGETETERLSFGELDRRARGVARALTGIGAGGRPVLVICPPGADFAAAFCGCLYAGAIAVSAPYQPRARGLARIESIAADCGPAAILAPARFLPEIGGIGAAPLLAMESLPDPDDTPVRSPFASEVALLQYTSGSTGSPRGIVVTHGNLAANLDMIRTAFGVDDGATYVSWLPLFHDMGLVGQFLHALYCGRPCILMPPLAFLRDPLRWPRAVSHYSATISGAPNFAYELCAARLERAPAADLDLSSWEVAFCGAEPVRAATMQRFAHRFGPFGFRASSLYPCYGLAEATVYVSGGPKGSGVRTLPSDAGVVFAGDLVSCGPPPPETRVEIVAPESGLAMEDGAVGEIRVAGEHVTPGYWNAADAAPAAFGPTAVSGPTADLRTGDLGLRWRGEIYVTGRLKDLIIVRGVNLQPQDIEASIAACHPAFGPVGAVFSVEAGHEEQVVAVHEVARSHFRSFDAQGMIDRALDAVAEEFGVRLYDLVLVRAGSAPRTTSGKVRRSRCRELYLNGELAQLPHAVRHRLLGRYQTPRA